MDAKQLEELTKYFDSRYVQKDTCSDRHEKQDSKMTELSIAQAKMQTTLSTITKIDIIILTAVIGLLATAIGGVIFK